jgi:hypothetical protein
MSDGSDAMRGQFRNGNGRAGRGRGGGRRVGSVAQAFSLGGRNEPTTDDSTLVTVLQVKKRGRG